MLCTLIKLHWFGFNQCIDLFKSHRKMAKMFNNIVLKWRWLLFLWFYFFFSTYTMQQNPSVLNLYKSRVSNLQFWCKNQQKKSYTKFCSNNFKITNAFLKDGNVENNQRNKLFSLINFYLENSTTTSVFEESR